MKRGETKITKASISATSGKGTTMLYISAKAPVIL